MSPRGKKRREQKHAAAAKANKKKQAAKNSRRIAANTPSADGGFAEALPDDVWLAYLREVDSRK